MHFNFASSSPSIGLRFCFIVASLYVYEAVDGRGRWVEGMQSDIMHYGRWFLTGCVEVFFSGNDAKWWKLNSTDSSCPFVSFFRNLFGDPLLGCLCSAVKGFRCTVNFLISPGDVKPQWRAFLTSLAIAA
ncbi:hypothetical protein R1flu_013508 [Riccia fluitans]|uniref:Uncharacterized protein n=1 Tax=Riccia fluitans TaxID=41844 RepID=A0ABD1YH45_9MARC